MHRALEIWLPQLLLRRPILLMLLLLMLLLRLLLRQHQGWGVFARNAREHSTLVRRRRNLSMGNDHWSYMSM